MKVKKCIWHKKHGPIYIDDFNIGVSDNISDSNNLNGAVIFICNYES